MNYVVKCKCLSIRANESAVKGDIITDDQLDGIDIQRLIDIGAIRPKYVATAIEVVTGDDSEEDDEEEETIILAKLSRAELNTMAAELGIDDVEDLPNKAAVIEAIEAAQAALTATEVHE